MITAMQEAELDPGEVIPDGKLHRFDVPGDRPRSQNGWYVLFDDGDNIQGGRFGSWKTGANIVWSSRKPTDFSPAEKKAYAAKMEAARRQREAEQQKVAEECRAWCKQAWADAKPATDDHPYLKRKGVKAYGLKLMGDALIAPVCSLDRTIHGIQFIQPDGTKKFKTGSAKQEHFHLIGKPVDGTMIVCEGYATGASIHEATGYGVLVAFDAGNLKPVAESIHKQRPHLRIIVAADDDQWTAGNPGATKAAEAAKAVGGAVVFPRFVSLETKPTDFNDLGTLEGVEAVRRQILEPLPPVEQEGPPPPADAPAPAPPPIEGEAEPEFSLDTAPFQLLGYDHGEYFFLAHGNGQVKALTADKLTKAHLLTLAPLQWWQGAFPARTSFDEEAARNMLIQKSHARGIYDADNVRGLGAWEDAGRSVLHLGDKLKVDGVPVPLSTFRSRYLYERAISISGEETKPLGTKEAHKLLELCDMLSWEKPINGRLLAGWCVDAIICGALKWRPHIWLTGPSGAGKSWVIHNIIKPVVGPHLKGMLGSTTEAGLRNALRNDAFSVFFDEFEAEDNHAAARIQSILEFARPASSNEDSKIYKAKSGGGGVNSYQPRSCFGVASINVNMSQKADISRVSVLSLVKGTRERFDEIIVPFWAEHFTPEFHRALRARTIALIPVIIANAEVFQRAITLLLGNRRGGDQYGALLAGAYSLCSSSVATFDQAKEWVGQQDWDGHAPTEDQSDELQCLSAILEGIVRHGQKERSIGELLTMAQGAVTFEEKETLLRHGIKCQDGYFVIANSHSGIARILEKTPWAGNWGRILGRLNGGLKTGAERFGGGVSRGVVLPMSFIGG